MLSQEEAWDKARSDGTVLSVGRSLGSEWHSAFVIPAYLQQEYPDLDSVDDLKDPQFKELFQTAESADKARLVSCVIGWPCAEINAAQIEGYGLSDHVHIVNPGSGDALNADLYGAYEQQEPWLGFQWETNAPALNLDLVRLKEPAYSDECWLTNKACAYPDSNIIIAVNSDLLHSAPDVVDMLRRWDFNLDAYKTALRWQDVTGVTDQIPRPFGGSGATRKSGASGSLPKRRLMSRRPSTAVKRPQPDRRPRRRVRNPPLTGPCLSLCTTARAARAGTPTRTG